MTSRAYRENYDLIEWAPLRQSAPRETETARSSGPAYMPDIAPFVAPGHVVITSRSALREYEKRTGTRQCGELKTAADFAATPPPGASTLDSKAFDSAFRQAVERVLGT